MEKIKQVSSKYFCKYSGRSKTNKTGPYHSLADILTHQPLTGCVTVEFKDAVNKCLKSYYVK